MVAGNITLRRISSWYMHGDIVFHRILREIFLMSEIVRTGKLITWSKNWCCPIVLRSGLALSKLPAFIVGQGNRLPGVVGIA